MHHFTGSTLEAKIQYIILLKHHFTGSFLKKNRLRRTSFYWGIILPGTYCNGDKSLSPVVFIAVVLKMPM